MNRFTGRLLLVDTAVLVSLFMVFSLVILSVYPSDLWILHVSTQYFSLFDLYFVALFLGVFVIDRASGNRLWVEVLVFLFWAGLSGFELMRGCTIGFPYWAPYGVAVLPWLFVLIKAVTFFLSCCLFRLFRFNKMRSELIVKGEWNGYLYPNLFFWAACLFILMLFVAILFGPTDSIVS